MKLSKEDQWMLAYLNRHIEQWEDVRDGATRSIKRIENHADFIAWADYFLPRNRKVELKKALINFKIQKGSKEHVQNRTGEVNVSLHEKAAKLLRDKAAAEQCSISEVLVKHLA